jgi:hypothetical protein
VFARAIPLLNILNPSEGSVRAMRAGCATLGTGANTGSAGHVTLVSRYLAMKVNVLAKRVEGLGRAPVVLRFARMTHGLKQR